MTYLGHTDTGEPVGIDVRAVIEGRWVITANSGAGKSFLIRRAMELTNGDVQQIIFDVEGDFVTLREKYDYLLVGNNGDLFFDPERSDFTDKVRTFAQQLRELRVSTIIDLSDLRFEERDAFIAFLLDALIEVPRKLWNPCLVVIDEAHLFAPQNGSTQSLSVVKDLMTRGRKRGLGGILATQRLSELNKTVADTANKLIGRTGLDVDQRRAAGVLGLTTAKQREGLALLQPGTFWAYGPAFSAPAPRLITIDPVETRHPQLGDHAYDPPPAPEGVRGILAALASGSQNEASAEEPKSEQSAPGKAELIATHEVFVVPEPCDHEPIIARLQEELRESRALQAIHYRDTQDAKASAERIAGELDRERKRIDVVADALNGAIAGRLDIYQILLEGTNDRTEAQGPDRPVREGLDAAGREHRDGEARKGDRDGGGEPVGEERRPRDRHAPEPRRRVGAAPPSLRPGGVGASESRAGAARGGRDVSAAGWRTEDMDDETVRAEIAALFAKQYASTPRVMYVPAPEVVRQEYLGAAAERLLATLEPVSADALQVYRYLMAQGRRSVRQLGIIFDGNDQSNTQARWGEAMRELTGRGLVDNNSKGYDVAQLARESIAKALAPHDATDVEVDEVYQLALGRLVGAAD